MKGLTIEQKAKAYDKALEKSKEFYILCKKCGAKDTVDFLEDNFPELAESEDERVRKDIVFYIAANHKDDGEKARWLYWLEKQGDKPQGKSALEAINEVEGGNRYGVNDTPYNYEHATIAQKDFAPKAEPTFKIGDWVVTSYGKVNQIITVDEDGDGFTLDDDTYFSGSWIDGYHLWSIADAKEGDVLVASDESLFIFARTKDNAAYYHYSLCKNGSQEISDGKHAWEVAKDCHPATKEQRDTLFAKMREAGYEWDAEKKELKNIHVIDEGEAEMDYCFTKMMNGEKVSSTWSEEDEENFRDIIGAIHSVAYQTTEDEESRIDWLKSLKSRVRHKPELGKEGKEHIESILKRLDGMCKKGATFTKTRFAVNQDMDWLKSLKQRIGG